jgi:hypothetical protein
VSGQPSCNSHHCSNSSSSNSSSSSSSSNGLCRQSLNKLERAQCVAPLQTTHLQVPGQRAWRGYCEVWSQAWQQHCLLQLRWQQQPRQAHKQLQGQPQLQQDTVHASCQTPLRPALHVPMWSSALACSCALQWDVLQPLHQLLQQMLARRCCSYMATRAPQTTAGTSCRVAP